jgi:short subunit dehydrogenase-like uncharacterized protein
MFDITLYGATGYTGRLVAEYLIARYGADGDLKWSMAGRDTAKLAAVREEIGAPRTLALVTADAADPGSLEALARQTKVVVTTVGPYQLYGDALVAACARTGTDYVDLTGESHWIAKMLAAHEAEAKASGARIVFSCGFDSIPFDLGVYYLQQQAVARFGMTAPRVRGRVRRIKGGLSGGTIASGMATMAAAGRDPGLAAVLANPFALTPGFSGVPQPDASRPYEDKVAGSWVAPFMMSAINTKAIHRSNLLLGKPWGTGFQYDEMLMTDGPSKADPGAGFDLSGQVPKPGTGPTRDERENGYYDILFIGEWRDGRTLRVSVQGDRDPGYGSTSKLLPESAVCLVRDVPHARTPGGMWTPASAMGEALLERLQMNSGLKFVTES